MTPAEQGAADARNGLPLNNPFKPFTSKWVQYNKGYRREKV